ncbi:uncharacterized protein M6B38_161770 [Iris pallida]|uniref:Uncharacterized protein n=1 Tax=Iris pallida TaxID=29817 RepID=A0AAX6EZL3_IRIPA|nr:uncharacterized protein M6B38_161770 [Iris pallida]
MGRIVKRCRAHQLRRSPYPIPLNRYASERRDWEQATCSVCLEFPHNAVLLLCSSHDKGCRPYMCGTNFRHSNCLDLFKKAYSRPVENPPLDVQEPFLSLSWPPCKKSEPTELSCPLCRGQVKGWTVVEPARLYLNKKKRSCIEDGCSFKGSYKVLRKHVRDSHPRAKPREVDPVLEAKWKALEMQSEQQDVLSTIRSSMPRSVVWGDYVIDMDSGSSDMDDFDDDDEDDEFDDGDGDGGSQEGRTGTDRHIRERLFYFLLQERGLMENLVRFRRNNSAPEEGGSTAVGYRPEEDDDYARDGRNRRRRIADFMRDDRRVRQPPQQRSRGRSASGRS